jgi:hypothetical protein
MIIQETTVSEEQCWRLVCQENAKECAFSRPQARFDQICFILLISPGIWICLRQTLQEAWFSPKIMLLLDLKVDV